MSYLKTDHTLSINNTAVVVQDLDFDYEPEHYSRTVVLAHVSVENAPFTLVFNIHDDYNDQRYRLDIADPNAGNLDADRAFAAACGVGDAAFDAALERQGHGVLLEPLVTYVAEQLDAHIKREAA